MVQGMKIGNKFYDSHSAGDPVMFGMREAMQKVQASLGIASVKSELPADITRQPVATANLPHHIQLASLVNQTTSVFIIDQKTVAFIPMGQHVLLLDSHCHAQSGAHIAMAPSSRIWELMEWYKAFNCFPYSMGTVTNVKFLNNVCTLQTLETFTGFLNSILRLILCDYLFSSLTGR